MKRKIILGLFLVVLLLPASLPASVDAATTKKTAKKTAIAKKTTINDLSGRLVLEYESDYKLWYIDPVAKDRYYLRNDNDLGLLVDSLGVTPPAKDFSKLAKNKKTKTPASLVKKYSGKIIVNPNNTSTAYYFNPADNISYLISNFDDFYKVGRVIGIGASDALLRQLKMNQKQLSYDPAFYGTAQVQLAGETYSNSRESKRILPLASLTKVMTALVFYDSNPEWNKVVEITPEEIKYPCTLQACGSTSEVNLKAGDRARINDLWVSMLTASSNQSAKILADNSGLSQEEFINKMNEKAKSLGLSKTRFVEMSGLSAENVSTAEEFAKIAQAAFNNETIAAATRYTDYVFTVEQADGGLRDVDVKNRNYSLLAFEPSASKTGYLIEAQRNAAIKKDNKIIVVLHAYSLNQRNDIVKQILENDELATAQ